MGKQNPASVSTSREKLHRTKHRPALLKVHQQVWSAKREDALRMGVQVRAMESQERRALEKLSCEMARCFYRSTYLNQTGRTRNDFTAPLQADRDADAQQMPHE